MDFVGILIKKVAEQEGDSPHGHYKVASYLVETVEMYPKRAVIDVRDGLTGRIAQWDQFIGKSVNIRFDINAREYNGRWFNSLQGWYIKGTDETHVTQPSQPEAVAVKSAQSEAVDWDKM